MSCLRHPAGAHLRLEGIISMTSEVAEVTADQGVFGGVDSYADTIHVVVISDNGGYLADAEFATTAAGYAAALAFLTAHGHVTAIGVEGTSSYGAGFPRTARSLGHQVIEVNRPVEAERRRTGKSDPIDAYAAARAALSGRADSAPKDDTVGGHPAGRLRRADLHLSHSTISRSCPTTNSLSYSGHKTTKTHLLADDRARPLAWQTTPGQRGDSRMLPSVLAGLLIGRSGQGRPRCRPGRLRSDKAYSSRDHRAYLRRRGIKATIAEPDDQRDNRRRRGRAGGRPPAFDTAQYRQRNAVERCVSKWKQFRAVATHFDKRDHIFNGALTVAAIVIWLRDTVQEPSETT
ncbi:transposase [Streptomyces sp. MST-110588]|uniref:transposase n=1 Tax=Streptomyces sp. MST-110588 TaxID=2833628 RepID=UPI001F5CA0CF|nr:transposase [Streptomyces sp. MST-110588]UNO42980.1 transposase [Streptomyces sp. MST-110588]